MNPETVTIVIPAYNAAPFLERAVVSVLAQTRKPDAIVMLDDSSTDSTWEIITRLVGPAAFEPAPGVIAGVRDDVKMVAGHKPHVNLPHTRNAGIKVLWENTTIYGFLDADDWYAPTKIERSLEAFALHSAIACVVSDYDNYHPDGRIYREYKPSSDFAKLTQVCLHNINCFVRKRAFEVMGELFDESLTYVEDYDLFLRLSEVGLIYHIPEVLHHRTVHAGNMSSRLDEMARYEAIVKEKMHQRRGEGI